MIHDRRTTLRLAAFQAAVVLLAVTRLPGEDGTHTLLAAASAALLAALAAAATLWRRAPPSLRMWLFVLGLATILVPPSKEAVLSWLPDWAPALAFVLALHVYFQAEGRQAPRRGSHQEGGRRRALRFVPATAAAAALLALPLALALTPLRIRATYELHTALAPLVPLVFLGGLLLAGGALRGLLRRESRDARSAAQPGPREAMEVEAA